LPFPLAVLDAGMSNGIAYSDSVELEYSRWPLEVVQIDWSHQLDRNLPFYFNKPVGYPRVLSILPERPVKDQ